MYKHGKNIMGLEDELNFIDYNAYLAALFKGKHIHCDENSIFKETLQITGVDEANPIEVQSIFSDDEVYYPHGVMVLLELHIPL